jgi:hypothetical protein
MDNKKPPIRIQVTVTPVTYIKIKKEAERLGVSMSQVIAKQIKL